MSSRLISYRQWTPPSAPSPPSPPFSRRSPLLPRISPLPPSPPLSFTDSDCSSDLQELSLSSRDDSLISTGPSSPASSPPSPVQPSHSSSSPLSLPPFSPDAAYAFFPFFEGLLSLDPTARAEALTDIRTAILPPPSTTPPSPPTPPLPSPLLSTHFPSLLRLALEAPFKDVREGFIQLLASIADVDPRYDSVLPLYPGASRLISDHLLPSVDAPTDLSSPPLDPPADADDYHSSSELLIDLFLSSGRISHFDRLLAFHPTYYSRWAATLDVLMADTTGPLLLSDRHYIAMIAASRFPSPYLLSYHTSYFLSNQGDPTWLQGIHHTPRHIQALSSLSTRLAYSPHSLRPSHLSQCLKDGGMSMSELVHAIAILTTYHSASAFTSALLVNEEVDMGPLVQRVKGGGVSSRPSSRRNSVDTPVPTVATRRDSKGEVVTEAQYLRRMLSDGSLQVEEVLPIKGGEIEEQIFPETRDMALGELYKASSSASTPRGAAAGAPTAERFYVDVAEVGKGPTAFLPSPSTPMFSFSSFTFHEHAAMGLTRYYSPTFSSLLLQEMSHLSVMTTHHIGRWEEGVGGMSLDTTPFRRAIQVFVERYMGVYRDDFNYKNIGKLLSQPLQQFIVRVCEGVGMTTEEWSLVGFELTEAEKVHIALIVMEARRQAELLYAMQALVALNE